MTPSGHDDDRARTAGEERAAEAVRSLSAPVPDAEFRSALREGFLSGEIAAGEPEASPRRRARVLTLPRVGALAAAAALAAIVWTGTREPATPPHWTFGGASGGEGELWICGKLMDPADPTAIEPMLHAGTPVRTAGALQADLLLPDRLSIQVAPEAEVTVPVWPGRPGEPASCEVARGEVRFATGPRYEGSLEVRAPLATIRVSGTVLAVIASAESSCVCVLEGEVRLQGPDGASRVVAAGRRHTVFPEGPSREEDILPMERSKLEMLRDRSTCP